MRPFARRGDEGVTLAEVTVAMVLMTFVMSLFTPAVVQIFDWTRRMEAGSAAQTTLRTALHRVDTEVRYASRVTQARTSGGEWYVEYRGDGATGTARCTRLKLTADGTLQKLGWTEGGFDPAAPWTMLATGIAAPAGVPPFARLQLADGNLARLRVRLVVTQGGAAFSAATAVDHTYTALNSADETFTAASDVCQEGRTP